MVYCGKPSKACTECRLRRTKCDTLRPSCSQCIRAGRTCRGYRDPADMMFRDESQILTVKRQRQKEIVRAAQSSNSKGLDDSGKSLIKFEAESTSQSPRITPMMLDLGWAAEDQATCFFFKNYVFEKEKFQRGNFHYLSEIYGSEEVGSALADSVASLGMVGLANFWGASNIMRNANMKYNSALRLVSERLRNVEEAKADQTMIAVMLLGLYETNTCNSPQSMRSWTKHISGAAALLHLRGKEQLLTPVGHHLFVYLRTQVITNCIQRHAPVPAAISEWSTELAFIENPEEVAATALSEISIKYCNLRASMSSFDDHSNPEYIISTACALDAECAEWARECPSQYIYKTATLKQRSDEVFSDHYHVYANIWIATVWNNHRCIRVLINELILDQLKYLFRFNPQSSLLWEDYGFYENQILASNSTLLQLCHDICASVPYFLGFDPDQRPNQRPIPKTVGGNLLIWPLYTAAVTGMVSDLMREWVSDQLRWISEVMGIRQAAPLALSLARKQDILVWESGETQDDVQSAKSKFIDDVVT